jgi:hypothetical protein
VAEAVGLLLQDMGLFLFNFCNLLCPIKNYHTYTYITLYICSKTRTCIITAGYPPMVPSDLSMSNLSAALEGVNLLYLDGYSHKMALSVAKQVSSFFKLLQQ